MMHAPTPAHPAAFHAWFFLGCLAPSSWRAHPRPSTRHAHR